MRDSLLRFYGTDPMVAWFLTGSAAFILASMVARASSRFRDWWLDRELERQDQQRKELSSIIGLTEPRPWTAPAAKGGDWRKRRVS